VSREVKDLDIRFQPLVQAWQEVVTAYVFPLRFNGFKVRITETYRDPARQEMLQNQGASQVKLGYHQVRRAFDFAIFDHAGVYLVNDTSGAYTAAGSVGEALGMTWGGRWKGLVDLGHLEWRVPGKSAEDLARDAGLIA
jgi:peptidoglycan L-alanyl-D-glutamate endopeptidase CwlK